MEKRPQRRTGPKFLERGAREGESPAVFGPLSHHEALSTSRVVWECSPNRAVNSGPRLNMGERPIVTSTASTRPHGVLGICMLRASACGLPIRPALKHGPRSLTCVRVNG
ncbi:unnamed protein product [Brassica napus]|uniref:(rape) hypothetical protein n=1 Tax=Brassica napus TaxID=3708 RepID=A0A816SKQ3_BRANA|nr:unnamed protein product [Brassica napus]